MDTRHELQQVLWEVIAEMERARIQGDGDQARRLERIRAGAGAVGMTLTHKELLMKLGAGAASIPPAGGWLRSRCTIKTRRSPTGGCAVAGSSLVQQKPADRVKRSGGCD
jgi:hypothetical protein